MEEKQQQTQQKELPAEEGIRLGDIFKLLLGKIKLLILVVIIGGILGGSFAIWRTIDVNYWGTTVEFYVNPKKPKESISEGGSQYGVYGAYGRHVMDNMVKLLESESFAEQMLLNGDVLPNDKWATAEEEEEYGIKAKIKVATDDLNALNEAKKETASKLADKNEQTILLSEANVTLNDEWKKLYYASVAEIEDSTFNETVYLKNFHNNTDPKFSALRNAYNHRDSVLETLDGINAALKLVENKQAEAMDKAEISTEAVLVEWRKTAKYKNELSRFSSALSFSYLESDADYEDANNLARSFIYVRVTTLNNRDFAEEVLERVKTVVPVYVADKMTVPDGYEGTNCQRITRTDDIHLTNPGFTTNQAIKYGILVGIAALVITAIVLIIVDKSDKRLRDTDVITKTFNVPLLGIVPSIEELKQEQNGKKKTDKNVKEVK